MIFEISSLSHQWREATSARPTARPQSKAASGWESSFINGWHEKRERVKRRRTEKGARRAERTRRRRRRQRQRQAGIEKVVVFVIQVNGEL